MRKIIAFLFILFFLSSCYYFRAIPKHTYTEQSIQHYEKSGKILILHSNDLVRQLLEVNCKDGFINARLDVPMGYHFNYLNPKEGKLNRFKKSTEPEVINSVHLYTSDTSFRKTDSIISIPVNTIYKVQSYEYAKTPSRASIIVPLVILPPLVIISFAAAGAAGIASSW